MDDNELRKQARKYLDRIRWLDRRIDQDIIELDQLRRRAVSLGATDYSRVIVQSSHDNSMEAIIAKIVDQQAAINQRIDLLAETKTAISAEIDQLEKPNHRTVLRYRYICLCKWEDIADRMGYDRRHVTRIHNGALKAFGEKMSHNVPLQSATMVS